MNAASHLFKLAKVKKAKDLSLASSSSTETAVVLSYSYLVYIVYRLLNAKKPIPVMGRLQFASVMIAWKTFIEYFYTGKFFQETKLFKLLLPFS